MRLGIGFLGELLTVREKVRHAVAAERNGLGSAWIAEHYYHRDPIVTAGAILAATRRIHVGTAVVNPYTRHPALLAMTAATLDEMSPGRFILGIGTGVPMWIEEQMGIPMGNPGRSLVEAANLTRSLLEGTRVAARGRMFRASGAVLGFRTPPPHVPIYLAAVGPKMLRTASRISDGVILSAGTSADYVARAIRTIDDAAGGRRTKPRVVSLVFLSVSATAKEARREVAPWLLDAIKRPGREELVLPESEELLAIARRAKKAFVEGDIKKAMRSLSGDVVETLSICGTENECLSQVDRFMVRGLSDVVLMPVSYGDPFDRFLERLRDAGLT